MTAPIPNAAEPIQPGGRPPTKAWRDFFQQLAGSDGQVDLSGILARLEALEQEGFDVDLSGGGSISVTGANNSFSVTLLNDAAFPDPTSYYGTGPDGARGWPLVADAIAATADLSRSVDSTTNVLTLGLSDLANSGTGTAIYKTTRDAKGRISGQVAATTNDLPEGASNLYFTNARAAAAAPVQSVNARTGTVSVPDYVSKATAPTSSDYGRALVNGDRWRNTGNGVLYTYQGGAWLYDNAASLSRYVPARLSGGTSSPIPLNADGTIPARLSNGTVSNIPTQA